MCGQPNGANVFALEPFEFVIGREVGGCPSSKRHTGMMDLDLSAVQHLDHEWLKRFAPEELPQRLFKLFLVHTCLCLPVGLSPANEGIRHTLRVVWAREYRPNLLAYKNLQPSIVKISAPACVECYGRLSNNDLPAIQLFDHEWYKRLAAKERPEGSFKLLFAHTTIVPA